MVNVAIHCDTSELDAALKKMDLLLAKVEQANNTGVLPIGLAAAAVATENRSMSRRNLLFWWRK